MENLTAILITFLRPGYTKACIKSLRETYPGIKIIVAENGDHSRDMEKFCKKNAVRYIQMPYDSGVCVARNALIKEVYTEYVLVGDDDFFYTDEARVDGMLDFLKKHKEYDLIGGRVKTGGILQNYQGFIEKRSDHFNSEKLNLDNAKFDVEKIGTDINYYWLSYAKVDLTFNFFVARTEKIKAVHWDEEIKVAYEHYSWFYDFKKANGRVAFTPDAVVIHKPNHINPEQDSEYIGFRNRKNDKERFFKKYNIKYIVDMHGRKTYAPDHVMETRKNDTKYVDFCITTFKRPEALKRLLFSIADHYPMANVYVADQNKIIDRVFYKKLKNDLQSAGLIKRVMIEDLPYDCGLSYARNHLVTTTPNKYKLILDDDMVFTEDTEISKFIRLLEAHPKAGIVGGLVTQLGTEIHFEFNIEKVNDSILHVPDKQPTRDHKGIKYKKTGCVLNFALIRKDLFSYITWDRNLKVSEHLDFYIRMQKVPYYILYTPEVIIDHPPAERSGEYKELRQRPEFTAMMLTKHGARRVKYLNGQVYELEPDGALKRYKELPN